MSAATMIWPAVATALMTRAEPRDRGVIRRSVSANHPARNILPTTPLDRPGGPLTHGIAIEQQRDHHRRIVRRTTVPVSPISTIEPGEIKRLDSVQHEPRDMVLIQPIPQARRQQQLQLPITQQKVLSHARK